MSVIMATLMGCTENHPLHYAAPLHRLPYSCPGSSSSFVDTDIGQKDGDWFFLDPDGRRAFPNQDYAVAYILDGECLALVMQKEDGKYVYIKPDGTPLNGELYDSAGGFSEGLLLVKQDGKYFFIKKDGTEAFPGQRFEIVSPFVNGFAWTRKDGKYYFLKTGAIEAFLGKRFDDAYVSSDGELFVEEGGRWLHFNSKRATGEQE
jgi:hypothetical protein